MLATFNTVFNSVRFQSTALRHLMPLLLIILCRLPVCAAPQNPDDVKDAPSLRLAGEVYRVRIQNAQWGRIEASADGGLHYMLIGRVQHPAKQTLTERTNGVFGALLRGGADGIAFAVGPDRVLKLRPHALASQRGHAGMPPAPNAPSEIITNLTRGDGLFGDLLPPPGSPLRLQIGSQLSALAAKDYHPSSDDVFVVIASPQTRDRSSGADAFQAAISDQIAALSRSYVAAALDRARAEGNGIFSGVLTLKAKLPQDEPDPIAAVTYMIDDTLIAAQNVGPYSFDWDTRRVHDGEYVVEISALNSNGRIITHARALIVVNNGSQTAQKP